MAHGEQQKSLQVAGEQVILVTPAILGVSPLSVITNQLLLVITGVHHQKLNQNHLRMIPGAILAPITIHGVNLQEIKVNLLQSQIPGVYHQKLNQNLPIMTLGGIPILTQVLGVNHQKLAPELRIMILGAIQIPTPAQVGGVNPQKMNQNLPVTLGVIPVQIQALGVMILVPKQNQQIIILGELGVLQKKKQKKAQLQMHGETALQRTLGVIQEQAVGVAILKILTGNPHGVKVEEMMTEIPDQEIEAVSIVVKKDTELVIVPNQKKKDLPEEVKWSVSNVAKRVTEQVFVQILTQNNRTDQEVEDVSTVVKKDIELAIAPNQNKKDLPEEVKWSVSNVAKKVIEQVIVQIPTQNNKTDQEAEDVSTVVKKGIELAIAQNQNKKDLEEAKWSASNAVKKVIEQVIVQAQVLEVVIVPEDEHQEAEVEVKRKSLQEREIEVVDGKEEAVRIAAVNQEKEVGIHPEIPKGIQGQAPGEMLMIAGVNQIQVGGIIPQKTKIKVGGLQSMLLGALLRLQL